MKTAILKDWQIIDCSETSFRLMGSVIGHPDFVDGAIVQTSPVQSINFKTKRAKTLNTIYMLEN
jgi:hypothetical protein